MYDRFHTVGPCTQLLQVIRHRFDGFEPRVNYRRVQFGACNSDLRSEMKIAYRVNERIRQSQHLMPVEALVTMLPHALLQHKGFV